MPPIRRITAFMFCCFFLQNPFADDLRQMWMPEVVVSAPVATYGALVVGFLVLCAMAASVALSLRGAM